MVENRMMGLVTEMDTTVMEQAIKIKVNLAWLPHAPDLLVTSLLVSSLDTKGYHVQNS